MSVMSPNGSISFSVQISRLRRLACRWCRL